MRAPWYPGSGIHNLSVRHIYECRNQSDTSKYTIPPPLV
jgi:hypothetical protein